MTSTTAPALEQQFAVGTPDHHLVIAAEDGVVRHLRCAGPGTGEYSFQVTTFPGHLAFTGDMGDYLFSWASENDVLPFFNHARINPGYWTSKLVAPTRDQIMVYAPAKLRTLVDDHVSLECFLRDDEVSGEEASGAYAQFTSKLHALLFSGDSHDWHSATEAVNELLADHDQPELEDVVPADISAPDPHFLRALQAIRWAAATYYDARRPEAG